MKRKTPLIVALAATLTAAALPASAEASHQRTCRSKGSATVLKSSHARIFKKKPPRRVRDDVDLDAVEGVPRYLFYGCLCRANRKFLLGGDRCSEAPGEGFGSVRNLRLAGRYVGYSVVTSCRGPHATFSVVRVKSLRTGRFRHEMGVGGTVQPPGASSTGWGFASDLELKPNGSVAWFRCEITTCAAEVRKADAAGEGVLLDSWTPARCVGENCFGGVTPAVPIDQDSLALSEDGKTVSWTKGGAPRSASID